jgi:energy-coupling factor transporter ATP-binding protein EcfA2
MRLLWLLPSLVVGIVLALTTHSWLFLLLSVVSLASGQLMQRGRQRPDAGAPVYLSAAGVAIGDKQLPNSSARWSAEQQQAVLAAVTQKLADDAARSRLKAMLDAGLRVPDLPPLTAVAGFSADGPEFLDLVAEGPHLFVIGPTGSGKSRWLELFLTSVINNSDDLGLWLADYKGGATLQRFAAHPFTNGFTTDLEPASEFWQQLAGFIERREREFAEAGIARIEQSSSLPRVVVVVDEMLAAIRSNPLATSTLETIATRGRSLGVHLIASSQGTTGMGRLLMANLRARLVLAGADQVDLAQLGITEKIGSRTHTDLAPALLATTSRVVRLGFPLQFRRVPLRVPLTKVRVPRRLAR